MGTALSTDYSAIWRSVFRYEDDKGMHEEVHEVTMQRSGKYLVLQSTPGSKVYCVARLTVDERVATGSWEMQGIIRPGYSGSRVWGALQLVLDDDGLGMYGMWVGFGGGLRVKSGTWTINVIDIKNKAILDSRNSRRENPVLEKEKGETL